MTIWKKRKPAPPKDRNVTANRKNWALCRLRAMYCNMESVGASIQPEVDDASLKALIDDEVQSIKKRIDELERLLRDEWNMPSCTQEDFKL